MVAWTIDSKYYFYSRKEIFYNNIYKFKKIKINYLIDAKSIFKQKRNT